MLYATRRVLLLISGSYEVQLDSKGELVGYRRLRRYARNQADRESHALTVAHVANLTAAAIHTDAIGLPLTRMISIHWEAAGVPLAGMAMAG